MKLDAKGINEPKHSYIDYSDNNDDNIKNKDVKINNDNIKELKNDIIKELKNDIINDKKTNLKEDFENY